MATNNPTRERKGLFPLPGISPLLLVPVLAVIAQATLIARVRLGGACPDALLAVVVAWGLLRGISAGIAWSFVGGSAAGYLVPGVDDGMFSDRARRDEPLPGEHLPARHRHRPGYPAARRDSASDRAAAARSGGLDRGRLAHRPPGNGLEYRHRGAGLPGAALASRKGRRATPELVRTCLRKEMG